MIDKIDRSQLARELIAEAAATWEDKPDAFKSERDGSIIFTFVYHSLSGDTVIQYNPQEAAEAIIEECERELEQKSVNKSDLMKRELVRLKATPAIFSLPRIAHVHFEDSLWELWGIAKTYRHGLLLQELGAESQRGREIKELLKGFGERKKKRLAAPTSGRNPVVTMNHIRMAIIELEIEGTLSPSQYAVAKKLKLDDKNVRDCWKRAGFKDWNHVLEAARAS